MTKDKGFTLLELCICLMIFGIFIECLGGFYSQCSMRYNQFREQLELTHEGQNVEDFIRSSIRKADRVKIKTTSGKVIEAITNEESDRESDVVEESLKRIECVRTSVVKGKQITEKYRIEMRKSGGEYSGRHALIYSGGNVINIISEQVENIKVTCHRGSNNVQFECSLQKEGQTNPSIHYTKNFSESLEYKANL